MARGEVAGILFIGLLAACNGFLFGRFPSYSCGETYRQADLTHTGDLQSPGWPDNNYRNNENCEWFITAPYNTEIVLTFVSFATESCCDHVKIYNPSNDDILGSYSGSDVAGSTFTSPGNRIRLQFISDNSVTENGFTIRYQAKCGCGEGNRSAVVGVERSLTSPCWPNNYGLNDNCEWRIEAPPNHVIMFRFNSFSTESCCDKLQASNVDDSTVIGQYSGSDMAGVTFVSAVNAARLQFTSDSSVTGQGFAIHFTAILPTSASLAQCGARNRTATVTRQQGLASPGWPGSYPHNVQCEWLVVAPPNHVVSFAVESFSTESCCDKLTVYNEADSSPSESYGGELATGFQFRSSGAVVRLVFTSDASVAGPGFSITYTAVATPCGDTNLLATVATEKLLTSPRWPGNYPNNAVCTWRVEAPLDHVVVMEITSFQTESSFDILRVYNDGGGNRVAENFSGSIEPGFNITSLGNVVSLEFTSDGSVSSQGFSIKYKARRRRLPSHTNPPFADPNIRCSAPPDLIIVAPSSEQYWSYGTVATAQCRDSVFVNGSGPIGRNATLFCTATGQWSPGTPYRCWGGLFVDMNLGGTATVQEGQDVLIFCDKLNADIGFVSVRVGKRFDMGEKFAFASARFQPSDHRSSFTCNQKSRNGGKLLAIRAKLNVQFPPIIKEKELQVRVSSDRKHSVGFAFSSNPPIVGNGFVTVTKDGMAVRNVNLTSNTTHNKVVLHFEKISADDLGNYIFVINSGPPFNSVDRVVVEIFAEEKQDSQVHFPILPIAAAVGGAVGVAFLVGGIIFYSKRKREQRDGARDVAGDNRNSDEPRVNDGRQPAVELEPVYLQPAVTSKVEQENLYESI